MSLSNINLKVVKMVGSKILIVIELQNSQTLWGKPITINYSNMYLHISSTLKDIGHSKVPEFYYDVQYLAFPKILEFVNGNIGLGYWLDKTNTFIDSGTFEVTIPTSASISYDEFIREKIEQPQENTRNNKEDTMNNNEYIKGRTFDVFPEETDRRFLFDYYLFDIDTDEIIEHGAIIASGSTIDEATKDVISKMQKKVGNKISEHIKVHLNYINTFKKPQKEDSTLEKLSQGIARMLNEALNSNR